MLVIPQSVKNAFFYFLPTIIVAAIYFTFFHKPSNQKDKEKINALLLENQNLARKNDSILHQIQNHDEDLNRTNDIIMNLFEEQFMLKHQVDSLNVAITTIQSKYEKANSHANNYNSNDIIKYMSDLK